MDMVSAGAPAGGDSAALCGYAELPITGYLDRMSGRAGETLHAYVSVRDGGRYRVRLQHILSADPNPDGPGLQFEDLSHIYDGSFDGRRQPIALGSYMEATAPSLPAQQSWTWTALVQPSMAQDAVRTVLHQEQDGRTLTLGLSATRAVVDLGDVQIALDGDFPAGRWYRLWTSFDHATRTMLLGIAGIARGYDLAFEQVAYQIVPSDAVPTGGIVRLGSAVVGDVSRNFNGKIEDPAILSGATISWPAPMMTLAQLSDRIRVAWDFSRAMETQGVPAVSADATDCDGRLVNLPLRAVVGARWRGSTQDWRHAPAEYAAIKFHEDDLGDCGWTPDLSFTIPAGLPSGAYAMHLASNHGEDWLPFYILPDRHGPHADAVFIAATYTYAAYGNNARGNTDQAFFDRVATWGAYPYNADQYPLYGRSTYNLHPDGSGQVYASRRRPLLTVRPGYLTFADSKGSGLRHYSADTHILAWAAAKGIALDIVTDDDLEREGAAMLAPYRAVLTGTHPEYHTAATLDALQVHVRDGGCLAYLGGNGFYWRIGHHPSDPWILELRRAENGIRRWGSEPGEYHHAIDGELGGLWSRNRRDPRQLVGVSFAAQGPYEASHFRRTEASYALELQWMFDGVEGDVLGDYGLIAGGAAGFEIDRIDHRFGTPRNAVVIAITQDLPSGFFPAHEDLGGGPLALGGGDAADLVRGDMLWFETPTGGCVFSASSITFCGSLWKDGAFQGPVSRLLENIVLQMMKTNGPRPEGAPRKMAPL